MGGPLLWTNESLLSAAETLASLTDLMRPSRDHKDDDNSDSAHSALRSQSARKHVDRVAGSLGSLDLLRAEALVFVADEKTIPLISPPPPATEDDDEARANSALTSAKPLQVRADLIISLLNGLRERLWVIGDRCDHVIMNGSVAAVWCGEGV